MAVPGVRQAAAGSLLEHSTNRFHWASCGFSELHRTVDCMLQGCHAAAGSCANTLASGAGPCFMALWHAVSTEVPPCCRDTKQRRAARANNMAKLISSDISFPVPSAPKRDVPAPKPEPVLAAAPSAAAAAAAPAAAKDEEEQVHDLIMHEIW